MDKLFEFIQRGKALTQGGVFQELMSTRQADESTQYLLADKQMEQERINGNGEEITNKKNGNSRYKRSTEAIYRQSGRQITAGDPYSMRYTGAFHESIRIGQVNQETANIDSQPIKPDGTNLLETYGQEILNLTPSNSALLAEDLKDECVNIISSKLGII